MKDVETEKYYFDNPFEDYTPDLALPLIDKNGLPRAGSTVAVSVRKRWEVTMNKLESQTNNDDFTIYTGTSGIGLLKLKKDLKSKENLNNIKTTITLPDKYKREDLILKQGVSDHRLIKILPPSFLGGDAGPLAINCVISFKLNDKLTVNNNIKKILKIGDDILKIDCKDCPCGLLTGKAGYLYSLIYVNKNLTPPPFEEYYIRRIIENILICGQKESKNGRFKSPLMYRHRDNYHLGASRGSAGILYILLQLNNYLTRIELQNLIKPTIDFLTTLRKSNGNFPREYDVTEDTIQWCNGAPGFIFMYCEAYKVFDDLNYLRIAEECGDIVWKKGLLTKGYSLCHGVAGNAYTFLILYQTTQNIKYLYRAIKFTEWCIDFSHAHELYVPDHPLSLFEGICGPMYLLLDIQNPMEAKFPGFTL